MEVNAVTPSAARFHRRALGLTQPALAKAAGVSASYVKAFESERLRPSNAFLGKLASFFASKGIKAEKLGGEYSTGGELDAAPRARAGRVTGMASIPQIQVEERQCFYVAPNIPEALVNEFLSRWEANEERIAELFNQKVDGGIFATYSEESEAALSEVFARLAENCVLFKLLTGWDVVENRDAVQADTVAGVVLTHYADVIEAKRSALGKRRPRRALDTTGAGEEADEGDAA